LPFKFEGLAIRLDTGAGYVAQNVGAEFLQDFSDGYDVLYNYQDDSFRFETALTDGDLIEFSGYPKYRVLSIATNDESIAKYGLRGKLIKDNSIEDQTLARQRAYAELATYSEEISDATFKTYTSGLRVGMTILLDSVLRDVETSFLIKKVVMKPEDPMTFGYTVELVTTKKYGLIELLQKIMRPDDDKFDPNEVAEPIKTDVVDISIMETIAIVSAVKDIIDVEIVEDIQNDPLGAGVAPEWVLAPYFPTGHSDPKREGRLDISLELS
jgi:hypothetical protein